MSTKVLILDAGGVLCLPRTGDWFTPVRFQEIIGEERLRQVTTEQLNEAKLAAAAIYLDESLLLPDETWEFTVRRNYILDLARRLKWELTDREADVLARDMTENDSRYDFYDDTREGLRQLSGIMPLALLSDAMPSLRRVFENAGLMEYFDTAVLSCEIGATKPNERMYRTVAERMEADLNECAFVDDRIGNLEGAKALGIRGIHMSRDGNRNYRGEIVRDLFELKHLLSPR